MKQFMAALGVIALLVMSFMVNPQEAFAKSDISIKATAGYDNKVQYGKGVPVTITLENTGDDFTGDLVIDASESYQIGSARALPITLASGETKTIQVTLSGLSEDYMYNGTNTQMFYLYEGGWEKGDEVEFSGDKALRPNFLGYDSFFIFTLTDSADRLTALRNVNLQQGGSTQIIALNQLKNGSLPTEKKHWEMATVLVIDESSIADWPDSQQQALLDWVKSGGIVLAGGTSQGDAEFGLLAEHLPLNLTNETTTISETDTQSFAKTSDITKPITIQTGSLKDTANAIWSVGTTPVVAMSEVNQGAIIQTAFSLGDQPLATEKGYDELLSTILTQSNRIDMAINSQYSGQSPIESLGYETVMMNELFPSFQVSTGSMFLIIFIYFLLVGPLLYFVLKRKDKREYMWWIIPSIAVLTSIAIFGFGARDRLLKPQIQQVSFYEVQEDGSMDGFYVQTLLSNRSGDFKLTAQEGTTMSTWKRNGFAGPSGNTMSQSILENEQEKPTVTLRNVGYWSTSSLIGETSVGSLGKLNIQLENDSKNVTGTIENTFPFPLKHVKLWTGSKQIDLGDIDAGATLTVNAPYTGSLLLPAKANMNYYGGGTVQNASQLPVERERAIFNAYGNMMMNEMTKPLIVATATEPILPITLEGERAELDAINVIIQPFEPKSTMTGEFLLPSSALDSIVFSEQGLYAEKDGSIENQWYMENGQFEYHLTIPKQVTEQKVNWTKLEITNSNTSLSVELLNQKTGQYEPLTETHYEMTNTITDYINKDNTIELRLNKQNTMGDDMTQVPQLHLSGEVTP